MAPILLLLQALHQLLGRCELLRRRHRDKQEWGTINQGCNRVLVGFRGRPPLNTHPVLWEEMLVRTHRLYYQRAGQPGYEGALSIDTDHRRWCWQQHRKPHPRLLPD